jgi:hypothetical protein
VVLLPHPQSGRKNGKCFCYQFGFVPCLIFPKNLTVPHPSIGCSIDEADRVKASVYRTTSIFITYFMIRFRLDGFP